MARIPLALKDRTNRPSLLTRVALGYARKRYGAELDSALATSHHPGVFWPWALMEMAGERRRSVLPEHLDHLVIYVTAMHLGCSWCVDFGASLWQRKRLDPAELKAAAHWRTSGAFDADQRAAFGYAETVSGEPSAVTDEMVADLRERFGDAGVVELTYLIALGTCGPGSTAAWAWPPRASAPVRPASSRSTRVPTRREHGDCGPWDTRFRPVRYTTGALHTRIGEVW